MNFNGPTSIDLGQSTSINSFSDADYLWEKPPKMIRKIWDNPGRIIPSNPGINRVGKYKVFRSFSTMEYFPETFRKMGSKQQHIPTGNTAGLTLPIQGIFRGVFQCVTTAG